MLGRLPYGSNAMAIAIVGNGPWQCTRNNLHPSRFGSLVRGMQAENKNFL